MAFDLMSGVSLLVLALLIALPSIAAWYQRRRSREGSEVAGALAEYAAAVKRERRSLPVDEAVMARARGLHLAEMVAFDYVLQLPAADPELLSEAAQRLARRLKRRVAFERKMLARTASGRRRGALAAVAPAIVILLLGTADVMLPMTAIALLVAFEAIGCWLLWQVARVEA